MKKFMVRASQDYDDVAKETYSCEANTSKLVGGERSRIK